MAEDPRIAQAAHSLGLSEADVIASAITETEIVLVFRQGQKHRVPLAALSGAAPAVPVGTVEGEPKAESAVPALQPEPLVEEPEEPARPRRRRGA